SAINARLPKRLRPRAPLAGRRAVDGEATGPSRGHRAPRGAADRAHDHRRRSDPLPQPPRLHARGLVFSMRSGPGPAALAEALVSRRTRTLRLDPAVSFHHAQPVAELLELACFLPLAP